MTERGASSSPSFKIKIPPLASTFHEVVQLYSKHREGATDIDRLESIVRRDAASSAYILKVVNSAYFGLRREVSQVERAIRLLGVRSVCNVVLAMGMRETFAQLENDEMRDVYQYIMKSSVATAAYARELALHLDFQLPDTAFAAGLVHQIGRLILLFNAPVAYLDLWHDPAQPGRQPRPPLASEERERFDRDYVEVGVQVARQWHFPKPLLTAIQSHRAPNQVRGNTSRTVALLVGAGQRVGGALFENEDRSSSSFFGLSASLTTLARERDLPTQELLDVIAQRREAVTAYVSSVVASPLAMSRKRGRAYSCSSTLGSPSRSR